MNKIRLFLLTFLLIFIVGGTAPVEAFVSSGNINSLEYNTVFSFGDGTNNLNIQWVYPGSGVGYIVGPNNTNALFPGTSDALIDNVGSSIDISSFDAEPGDWHDLHDSFVTDQWVAFQGLNGYYGLWHIENYSGPDSWGRPGTLNGTWYFQDDGTSYFGISSVPVPGAIWLLGIGFIGLMGYRRANI